MATAQHYSKPMFRWFMKDVSRISYKCVSIARDAAEKSRRKNKNIHRIESILHRGMHFICEVKAAPAAAFYTVYRFMNDERSNYCIAYDEDKKVIYHFSAHFFQRYHERLMLHINDAERLMKHYLHQNGEFTIKIDKRKHGRFCAFTASYAAGIGYGVFDIRDRIYYFRTFISFSKMCTHKKIENNVELTTKETISLLSKKFLVNKKQDRS